MKSRTATSRSSRTATARGSSTRPVSVDLPSWTDLVESNDRRTSDEPDQNSFLGAIPTVRFILGVLAVAGLFTLYVGHVYATQDLLSNVQTLRKENLELHLELNRTTGEFGRKTSPSYIYSRAADLDLSEQVPQGAPILIH